MNYTKITQEIIDERDELCVPPKLGETVKKSIAKQNIGYFMYHQLGMKPYAWQYYAFKMFRSQKKHQIWCTPRQYLGKTTCLSVIALQSCVYNLYPIQSKNNQTIIGIISRSEEQSKKIISDIVDLMRKGDDHISKITGGKIKTFFTSFLDNSKEFTQTKTEMTFVDPYSKKQVGKIICLPPTDRVRGYTFSQLLMDEAAFFEDDDFFLTVASPTLNMTNGKLILASTPNGQRGFFFKVFNPFEIDDMGDSSFDRLWFHWTDIEDEKQLEQVEATKDLYYTTGRGIKFEQEYEAKFTAAVNNFFLPEKIDESTDTDLQKWNEYTKPTDCGIDFGMTNSNTCITISRLGDDHIIRLVYHHVYNHNEDNSLVLDLKELIPRFNIQRIIVDDCPEGYHFIQRMKEEGMNVRPMKFKAEKVAKYGQFRSKLYSGNIKFYKCDKLIAEMKALEEEETIRSTRISKPSSGSDDLIDSFMMSTYYFIEDKKPFRVVKWDDRNEVKPRLNPFQHKKERISRWFGRR